MKKVITLCLTFIMLMNFGGMAFAQSATLEELESQYQLKDISQNDLPEGVVPIEFSSVDVLGEFLADQAAQSTYVATETTQTALKTSGSQSKIVGTAIVSNFKMYAYYEYANNRFTAYNGAEIVLVGFTPGTTWSGTGDYGNIIDAQRTLACNVDGVCDYYLLIEGMLKLYSVDKSFYAEFYL